MQFGICVDDEISNMYIIKAEASQDVIVRKAILIRYGALDSLKELNADWV